MAILHGNWIPQHQGGYLFIWGETWRPQTSLVEAGKKEGILSHPLAMGQGELVSFLRSHKLDLEASAPASKGKGKGATRWIRHAIASPTGIVTDKPSYPIYSPKVSEEIKDLYLYPWAVEGLCLNATEAIKFLQALPLSSFKAADAYVGGEMRFWAQVCRWSLDLLARGKFLPGVYRGTDGSAIAYWQPLLDSAVDRERLEKFAQQMPAACRTYQDDSQLYDCPFLDLPTAPDKLLLAFLSSTIDAQVRAWGNSTPPTTATPVREWLQAVSRVSDNLVQATGEAVGRLETALQNWTAAVQDYIVVSPSQGLGQNLYRTCFAIYPPASGETNWRLEYFLQAADDTEFLISASRIWNHTTAELVHQGRKISHPQETFLKGLGLAARLFAPIEPSLKERRPQSCLLTPLQAYEFIKAAAWRLKDSGLGVILPPSLASQEGWANRLGLKIQAQTPQIPPNPPLRRGGNQRIGLQSLLNFKWELSIGGQTLSKAEFDRLVAQNTPLVEINGEWVELRAQDVRAAQTFFASRKEQMELSLEDALRLSTGDTQTIEKLPVVSFEASGTLEELLSNLTNNRAIEPIEIPKSFRGKLRPFQERGVAWLSFLERWGLGACLADSMGMGKCIVKDSLVYINGIWQTPEQIWQAYKGETETEFDGEGFWSVPSQSLLVNAIDEKTGKIVLAPIQRLYRQHVCEKLRQVKLKDGSSITITQRHKLLTNNGWTNNFNVGDYVCVPAKLVWHGKPEDPDLVKFLAWQIAEGHENNEKASLSISQKDQRILEELRLILLRFCDKYEIKINNPVVRRRRYRQNAADLILYSRAYQNFLVAKGYSWGRLSKDKSIPSFIMQADLETVRIFLTNYFDAEGSVISSMRSIEIATASHEIIHQLSILLRRFGIWLRIAAKQKRATNGTGIYRTYYIGTLGGNSARRFYEYVGFGNPEKQWKLQEICQKVSNTNVEGIPASDIFAQAVGETKLPLRHFGVHSNVYIKGSQQFSRNSLEKVIAGFDHILSGESEQQYRQLKPSKWTTQTLDAYAQLDVQQLSLTRQRLQYLLNQEVFYCQIESIEDVEYNDWVYDFEVSEHHNFVANNILCHNTIQTIAFMLHLQEQEALEAPVLLVCPTSVLGNWEREVKKFGPTIKTLVHHGDKRAKGKALAKAVKDKNLVITSYPLVFRDAKDLQSITWQGVVLDEAQNIKNPDAKQSKAVRELQTNFRIALTGTPVENRLSELWSIMDFLNPGYLGQRQFFQRRFGIPIEKYGDGESLKTLRSLVQPFILRRLKTDKEIIQDLPEKQEMTVFCPLAVEQASLYQKIVEESLAEIESADGIKRKGMILALITKLKQICNHPVLFNEKSEKEKSGIGSQQSGKLQRLDEMLEELVAEGDRALIFTQFAEWGKLLKPHLEKQLEQEVLFLYGSTAKKQREEMIDRFQNDPEAPKIFILSLKAGGVGLNLTRATHVFHFDRWWNPAVENQATDRVFRIGQTRNVQVHKFVCTGTLEEKIHDLIESKKALAEQVVGAGENWLTELDTDQLRNLLLLDRSSVIDDEEK